MAYQLFNGQLDDEESPGYALFTGELDTGKRELPKAPAPGIRAAEPVSIPATGDAMGGDFGSAIMDVAAPTKTSASVLEGRTFPAQPELDRRLS